MRIVKSIHAESGKGVCAGAINTKTSRLQVGMFLYDCLLPFFGGGSRFFGRLFA